MSVTSGVVELRCVVQNYDWGKVGSESVVAQLSGAPILPSKPYAELWMGTHVSGPSKVDSTGQLLGDWIKERGNEALGKEVQVKWPDNASESTLPYLFKVLSIAKALSIQAHPDKALAKRLFAENPQMYKDPNHKPEMALALTPFEALCSFRPANEIKALLNTVPELRQAVGSDIADKFDNSTSLDTEHKKAALKELFTSLMTRDTSSISQLIQSLISRLQSKDSTTDAEKLALRLNDQFPNDIGIFSSFLLNYIKMKPGDAIFLAANEPHAYISGECAECMAASDNVVRAGLTPKPKDVKTLCSMLTYRDGPPEILKGEHVDECTIVYTPPIDEFLLERTTVARGTKYTLRVSNAPSILLVYTGSGDVQGICAKKGTVVFAPADVAVTCQATEDITILKCTCKI